MARNRNTLHSGRTIAGAWVVKVLAERVPQRGEGRRCAKGPARPRNPAPSASDIGLGRADLMKGSSSVS